MNSPNVDLSILDVAIASKLFFSQSDARRAIKLGLRINGIIYKDFAEKITRSDFQSIAFCNARVLLEDKLNILFVMYGKQRTILVVEDDGSTHIHPICVG